MSESYLVYQRAIVDPEYRALLFRDADQALAGLDLNAEEEARLRAMTPDFFEHMVGAIYAHRYVSLRATPHILIIPEGRPDIIPEPGDIPIILSPATAFGNGQHSTTRMALVAIEKLLRRGDRVLDLGTGSGILSIAAAKLGAASVLGLDISQGAVAAACENIRLNGVEAAAQAELGSLPEALALPPFDIVIANILAPIIVDMLGAGLERAVRPGGRLVLSGIALAKLPDVMDAIPGHGLALTGRYRSAGGWAALELRREEG